MTTPAKYTDEQMALILQRAAELQAAGEEHVHSLESIQQLALQVGIDPALVAHAAATLPSRRAARSTVWGDSPGYRLSRRMPGPVRASEHAALVATIRDHMSAAGLLQPIGDGFEWHCGPADNKIVVALSPAGDETNVRVDVRQPGPRIGLYLAAGVVTAVAAMAGTIASPAIGAATLIGVGAASYAGARRLWHRVAERSRGRAAALVDALTNRPPA
jgi:hypothetical protein